MDILTIDIETAQARDPETIDDIIKSMKAPANYKKPEAIEKWLEANKENAIAKTSFDGFAGSIICIGFAINDDPVHSVSRDVSGSEKDMITNFFETLVAQKGVNFNPLWVAHNVNFDLPFLYKRLVVNNIKPPIPFPVNPKPWSKDVFCTMYNSVGDKAGGSLNRLSRILGLGQKTEGIDGSKINQAWLDGHDVEISEYCRNDVELCRGIYKRLNFV